jgi:hypothetical protein
MVRHARTGVEVELESRPDRVVQVLARVQNKLETSHRTGERGVRNAANEAFQLRARKPHRRHDLYVEVAGRWVEITEGARAEEPRPHETVAQRLARHQLGQVGLDLYGEHCRILS